MNSGAWHQCGFNSQLVVKEQLEADIGVGVIISPRDLAQHKAIEYSADYKAQSAEVLIDPQFYCPDFCNGKLSSYQLSAYRKPISELAVLSERSLKDLANRLENDNMDVGASAVIAPAVIYDAGRTDIIALNKRLFSISKAVGDNLGVPTYASVFLGRSITSSRDIIRQVLSSATSLEPDGWYFGYEFEPERIPSDEDCILRFLTAGLALSCTGKPVLNAFAGPLAPLALLYGATGAAVGQWQNLWHFERERWQANDEGGGGGGDAPPRFFSHSLWGTIVYPDETVRLEPELHERVLIQSPYSIPTRSGTDWKRWDSNKHLIYIICDYLGQLTRQASIDKNTSTTLELLASAVSLYEEIKALGIVLKDNADAYQANWHTAVSRFRTEEADDLEYLELIKS